MLRQSQLKISRGAAGLDSAMRQPALFGFDLRFSTSSGSLTPPPTAHQPRAMTVREGQIGVALFDDQFIQDPYPLYERMHAGGPVHQIGDSGFHAVCTWDAVNDVVARPEDFSSNLTASMTYQDGKVGAFTMGELGGDIQALATADDPAHAEHRKLLVPQLAARRINALEPFIGETADRLWDEGVRGGTIE